jgi:hypothetical protein
MKIHFTKDNYFSSYYAHSVVVFYFSQNHSFHPLIPLSYSSHPLMGYGGRDILQCMYTPPHTHYLVGFPMTQLLLSVLFLTNYHC